MYKVKATSLLCSLHLQTCLWWLQESVKCAVAARPEQFVCASKTGTEATEEMVEAVAAHYGLKITVPV